MNICITSHDMEPQYMCGIKRVSSTLANEWIKEYNVYFITFSPVDNQIKEVNGIQQFHFPVSEDILAKENVDYFTTFVKEKKIDIILHQHCDVQEFTELCIRVAQKENVKLVTTLHFSITHKNDIAKRNFLIKHKLGKSVINWIKDFAFLCKYHLYKKYKNEKEYYRLYKNLISNSDKFVLLSTNYIPILTRLLKLKNSELTKVTAINNPIIIKQQPIEEKRKRVIWCGRVEYGVKRVDRILDIWKNIAPQHPDWELCIMGSGDIEYFRNIVKRNNIQNVTFTGFCNPYDYYKNSSIICMTSSVEGLPMVLLEAQMFGCVPIAYNSFAGLQDIIIDNVNGFKVKAFDKKEFITKLEWMMENENERCRIAQECRKSTTKFNLNIISTKWIELFKDLTNERI